MSTASWLIGMRGVALALLALNLMAFAVLWVLTLIRVVRYPRRFAADVAEHRRGPGFFTIVAATCVLGAQLIVVSGARTPYPVSEALDLPFLLQVPRVAVYVALAALSSRLRWTSLPSFSLASGRRTGDAVCVHAAALLPVLAMFSAADPPAEKERLPPAA